MPCLLSPSAGLPLQACLWLPSSTTPPHQPHHTCSWFTELCTLAGFFWRARGRAEGEEKSEAGSMLGLSLKTLRLWPEPESEVGYLPDWATQVPRDLLTHFCHQTISCSFIPQRPSWALSWETFSTTCRQGSLLGASLVYLQVSLDSAVTLFNFSLPFLA